MIRTINQPISANAALSRADPQYRHAVEAGGTGCRVANKGATRIATSNA